MRTKVSAISENSAKKDIIIKRRDMLRTAGAVAVAASAFPLDWVAAADNKKAFVIRMFILLFAVAFQPT